MHMHFEYNYLTTVEPSRTAPTTPFIRMEPRKHVPSWERGEPIFLTLNRQHRVTFLLFRADENST